jgi:hypothetical protein
LLTNGRFEDGKTGWNLEAPAPAQAELGTEPVTGDEKPLPEGQSLHLKLAQPGTETTPVQVTRGGLSLTRGTLDRVQFWAKSSVAARAMQVNMRLGQAPWTALGLMENVQVTDKWQPFSLTFTAPADIQEKARLAFTLTGKDAGDLYLANVKFSVAGDRVDLADGQTLEAGNLEIPRVGANRQGADFLAFQMQLEKKYVDTMTDTIKKELGSKAIVTCSQDGWGGLGGVLRESRTDYVDMHAYWQHPEFPNGDWSRSNWLIGNSPLVKSGDGGTMSELAMHRVEGKPFTVSEYNHPAPSDYACEAVPFLAAFAAWQDWDGIFLFDYSGNASTKRLDKVNTWFSVETDSNKTAYLPAAARLFLGGQMAPAATPLTFVVPKGQIPAVSAKNGLSVSINWYKSGVNRKDVLKYRDAIRLVDGNGDLSVEKPGELAAAPSFLWFTDRPSESYFRVSSPDARWLVGYPSARWQNIDGLSVTAEPTKFGLVALGLTARDGKAIADSNSLLLTIGTHFENQNMGWNEKRNSVGEKWGDGPMMGEGVKASISVDTHAKAAAVYALDVTGARNGMVPSKLEGGKLSFNPSPEYKTVWYEIELK